MAEELAMLVGRYGARRFYYVDDNFLGYRGMGRERLSEFAEEILRRGLRVEFAAEFVEHPFPADIGPRRLRERRMIQSRTGGVKATGLTLRRRGRIFPAPPRSPRPTRA